ncbi:adhesion G protein-coupled receptor E2 isoform X2 [Toxotes jaculatrix]|uniref:adhesion G protein-coupled receptor E2 isoform X2 n=1 Tax=Toxotes jaculatrix TaxID=941984 RepID=UPI001B3AACE7|nr:adhesion G protein-coupled receptor E2 isoform X2 [Toxotes jaculatrix]
MVGRWNLLILALWLFLIKVLSSCPIGFDKKGQRCVDFDECASDENYPGLCGEHALCFNTNGSFYCQCADGFRSSTRTVNFSSETSATCRDINECLEDKDICGPNAICSNTSPYYNCTCLDGFISTSGVKRLSHGGNVTCTDIDECQEEKVCGQNAACVNTQGSYHCLCNAGFLLKSGQANFSGSEEQCEDICTIDKTICGNGTCHRGASGHYCACHTGFTNYGNNGSRCSALNCDVFKDMSSLTEELHIAHDLMVQLEKTCLDLTESESPTALYQHSAEDLLKKLLSMIDELLSSGTLSDKRKVSFFLDTVENALRMIGPFIQTPGTKMHSLHTELELLVHKGTVLPQGAATLSSKQAQLDIQLGTAAGDPSYYPGFTTVSLLSYAKLEDADGMKQQGNQNLKINSKVVTVTVSNRNTSHLKESINLTFYHLKKSNETGHCVFWDSSKEGGAWSSQGCNVLKSNHEYTVCSCTHLSSFAVLMALYDMKHKFELQLISWVGLSLSLVCLFICILTFSLIRSIQSPRTTIHLHLCISLFIANLIFLAGISRTENQVGCAVVAGLLHFFFLAAFCWMCLEGIQLFRMVVLVFNTNFRTLHMMAGGYGVPAVIVAISALANPKGYGTDRHCWLNLEFIWSFFGPACFIIIVNIFFFLITVWKLAQKFSSLNPDLDSLQKIKAFTITAVAQLCVLGIMWIFGCFQFEESTIAMSYLFTIFGSLQGVMLFVMHCLFSKQVREEYGNFLSRCCAPQKKSYSEFGYSHSSKAHASKSTQDTGESHI